MSDFFKQGLPPHTHTCPGELTIYSRNFPFPMLRIKGILDDIPKTPIEYFIREKTINHCSLGCWLAMTKLDYYFHHSYSFIPNFFIVVNVSYRMSPRIKKVVCRTQKSRVKTPSRHQWSVGFCRQCCVAGSKRVPLAQLGLYTLMSCSALSSFEVEKAFVPGIH